MSESPSILYEYFEVLKSDKANGNLKLEIILDEVNNIEEMQRFTILPEGVRDISSINLGKRSRKSKFKRKKLTF